MKNLRILGFIFIVLGLGLLLISFNYYEQATVFIQRTVITTGTIVSYEIDRAVSDEDLSTPVKNYYPVISFETVKGKKITFKSKSTYNPAQYKVGDQLSVRYNPKNPQEAEVFSVYALWIRFAVVFIFGLIFTLIGWFEVYRSLHVNNNAG